MSPLQALANNKVLIEERAAMVTKAYQELVAIVEGCDQDEGSKWVKQERFNIELPSIIVSVEHWGDWRRTYHNENDAQQYYLDDEDAAVLGGVIEKLTEKYPTLNISFEQDDCELLIIVIETKPLTDAKP